MYDQATAGCSGRWRARSVQAQPPLTWTALAPLALPDLPEEIGRRLVEEHLLDPPASGSPCRRRRCPPPSPASRSVTSTALWLRRYLARPDLGQRGLARVARPHPARLRREHADELASRIMAAVLAEGLARVLRPFSPAVGWARPISPGPRWRWRCSTPTRRRVQLCVAAGGPGALTSAVVDDGPSRRRGVADRLRGPRQGRARVRRPTASRSAPSTTSSPRPSSTSSTGS